MAQTILRSAFRKSQSIYRSGFVIIRRNNGTDCKRMLAWQINAYGDNSKLQLANTKIPIITKQNQVLVKIQAASINPIDLRMRGGYGAAALNKMRKMKDAGPEFPRVFGRDCSGVVAETGKRVKCVAEGDEVWAAGHALNQGTHAQYVLYDDNELGKKPKNLSHIEAASIPYVTLTVWNALYTAAGLRPENAKGKKVLVHAGAGGIGSFAIQLLNAWGAEVATTCSPDAVQLVTDLGAKHAVDYKSQNAKRQLRQVGKFDVILDTIGGATEDYSIGLLKDTGDARYVSLRSPVFTETDSLGLLRGGVSAGMQMFGKVLKLKNRFRWAFATPSKEALDHVKSLVEKGQIRPVIEKVFEFSELPAAMALVETGRARGKTVIDMSKEPDSM